MKHSPMFRQPLWSRSQILRQVEHLRSPRTMRRTHLACSSFSSSSSSSSPSFSSYSSSHSSSSNASAATVSGITRRRRRLLRARVRPARRFSRTPRPRSTIRVKTTVSVFTAQHEDILLVQYSSMGCTFFGTKAGGAGRHQGRRPVAFARAVDVRRPVRHSCPAREAVRDFCAQLAPEALEAIPLPELAQPARPEHAPRLLHVGSPQRRRRGRLPALPVRRSPAVVLLPPAERNKARRSVLNAYRHFLQYVEGSGREGSW
jgi:hypothetical protein